MLTENMVELKLKHIAWLQIIVNELTNWIAVRLNIKRHTKKLSTSEHIMDREVGNNLLNEFWKVSSFRKFSETAKKALREITETRIHAGHHGGVYENLNQIAVLCNHVTHITGQNLSIDRELQMRRLNVGRQHAIAQVKRFNE